MDITCKQQKVVRGRTEVPEPLDVKAEERHTHDQEELCPVQKETEAGGGDCRGSHSSGYDRNSDFSGPINQNIDKELDIKCHSSVCGETSCDSSQHHSDLNKQLSSCDDKDDVKNNKDESVRDFCKQSNPLQSGLNNQVKEEISASDSGGPTIKNLLCFFCGTEFATGGLLTKHISIHTGEKVFCCIICNRTFTLESELVSHVCATESSQNHQSKTEEEIIANKLLNCSRCGEEFSRRQDLNVHLRCHTREDSFKCSVCSAVCTDRDALIQHMRIHTRQTQFNCSVCGKDFAWRRHLTKHMEVHKKRKKVFRCRVCSAEFCTYYVLSKHKLIHQSSEVDPDQTEENEDKQENMETAADGEDCGEPEASDPSIQPETDEEASPAFKAGDGDFGEETRESQSDLISIKHDDFSESDKKMDIEQFTYREDLSRHTVYQTEVHREVKQEEPEPPQIKVEPEETEITKFTFSPVPMKTEEDEEKPQFSELYLNQTEESRDSVGGPELVKNSDLDFGAMSFKSDDSADSDFWKETKGPQSGLNSETESWKNPLSGSDEKPLESLQPETDDSVDSDFWKDYKKPQSSLNSLKHEASERGAKYVNDLKPYSCSMCSKAFRYSSYLKTHMKQHTERYFCSLCGYKSTSSSNLKVHMRTHTGEKPFSCPVCDKKYTNKASMQSHMSVHAAERKYSCDVCKKSFAWYTELKYHQCVGESSQEQTYEEEANINLKCNKLYS